MRVWSTLLVLLTTLLTPAVHAKDLANRLGIGYSDQFELDRSLPSLAVRYYPNSDYGLMGSLGVNTTNGSSRFGLGAKIVKVVFKEDNLNFYTGAGVALISEQISGSNNSGFEIAGVFGAEFFLPGLESLGFSFEAGVGVLSIQSQVRFTTIGDSPLKAGIIFYF